MKHEMPDKLDQLIDDALRSEAMRPSPPAMHRKIEYRLRIAALLAKESREFKQRVIVASVGTAAVVLVTAAMLTYLGASERFALETPGFLGFLDYWRAQSYSVLTIYSYLGFLASALVLVLPLAWACGRFLTHRATRWNLTIRRELPMN